MRLLHTSDWHLGRRLCDVSLLADQEHVLEQVYEACRSERVDALVIAGDVYDRAIPPEEAVRLLSDFAARITQGLGVPLIAISGNHDSAERLGFGAALLEQGRLFLRTGFGARARPIPVGQGAHAGHVYCLPYTEPEAARLELGDDSLRTHDAAVRAALEAARATCAASGVQNSVLVGHLFAAGGQESQDSERPLVVGGAAHVSVEALEGFSYVALGHLHAPQGVGGREDIRYSGSPLKYAFSEARQQKGLSLVEIEGGRARVQQLALNPLRDVVRLEGSFDALLKDPQFAFAEGAYVEATYTDTGYLIDVASRLRQRFPLLLTAMPRYLVGVGNPEAGPAPREVARLEDTHALLSGFWKYVDPSSEPDPEHLRAFEEAVGNLLRSRGAGAEPTR
ncbi:exonuclease SbcCD subunit D [Aggregicoccus sp. 17bor-14]|uniref:exonuclease SbcCD subunit D n=1 Tax=Myxococcaceae TaxID=31 RepID=UPI00129C38E3|nr:MULTISPECIES: exonuclease SbcCD subunit D [Myxococcaceae]MBF5042949.1 exonuclease SbcCD subunit D [Simulacricoccus sp. 17bor-14]MRI88715.1 exonuclease SbcCD subunit D [Aggregicoccus sp. 17bor-14]